MQGEGEGEEVVDGEAVEETDMLNGGGCNLMQSVVFLTWIRVAVLPCCAVRCSSER